MMGVKNKEDLLKSLKDPNYNQVLRETVKLLMNSISGKLIEGMHLYSVEEVNKYKLLELSIKHKGDINIIKSMGSTALISYEKDKKINFKHSRPVYLGVLIYDYAQMHMYDSLYSKIGLKNSVYTDTDSLKMTAKDGDEWVELYGGKTLVRHWKQVEEYDQRYKDHVLYNPNSKVFGSFENEYTATNVNYFLDKKNYLSCFKNNEDFKMSLKGG